MALRKQGVNVDKKQKAPSQKVSAVASPHVAAHPAIVRHHVRCVGAALSKLKECVAKASLKTYFDVKDSKEVPVESDALKCAQYELDMLKGVARAAIGRTGLRTKLFVKISASSGAGAALQLVQSIAPSASAEWASFQALFDDYKVLSATADYSFASSVASVPAASPSYGVCYDATYASNPGSIAALMESDRHQIGMLDPSGNYPVTSHPSGSKNGLRRFHIKEPRSLIISPSAVTGGTGVVANFPGSWIDMGDATSAASGYLKFLFEATTTSVITLTAFLEYEVEFRQRT